MPAQGITFDGAFIGLPGAYYADDVSPSAPNTPPTTPPMLVLGYGWGPKPFVPQTFTNAVDFANAVRGAPISVFIPFIANPSPAVNGAQLITFLDVSSNTQSSATISVTGTGAVGMTSVQYGPPSNQLTYQVAQGSVGNGAKITITDNYAGGAYAGDDLGIPFQLAYSGAATTGLTFFCVPSGAAPTFYANSPNAGESVAIPLASGQYDTVSLLVEYLNGTSNWFAQLLSSTNGTLPSIYLNPSGSALNGVSGGLLQYHNVFASTWDPVWWLNQFAGSLVTATNLTTGSPLVLGTPIAPTFFSGAAGVPPTAGSYASGLTAALGIPAWTVVCDSNAVAVQALLAQHCEIASSAPYGMWRRGFTGSNVGDTVAATQTNAMNLDSLQMAYVYPGIYRTNTTTGQNQLYGGLYAAFAAAAMATGNIVALPLTNKALNGNGVEAVNAGTQLSQSQLNALQDSGVMALWQTQQLNGPPTILSDVTTWQVDDNIENTSSQQVACRYWLAYSVVNVLRQYVGTIAAPTTEINILNAVKSLLNALIYTGGSSNGVLASWDTGSLILTYTGTQELASITVNVVLVGQNRYITVFASVQPLNFTITAVAA